jgi:hypothetical protein
MLGDVDSVDLQDLHPRLLVGQGNLNLSIQAAGPQESRVQDIWPIGGHDHFHLFIYKESFRHMSLTKGY